MISATIAPCAIARWASIGSPVTSPIAQTLRIEVAHWASMRTNGPLIVRSSVSRPEAADARAPADRDQRLVCGDVALLAVRRRDRERAFGVRNRPRADQRFDAKIGEAARERLGQFGVVKRQDFRQRFDDRHPGAELGEGHAELHPDIARADHGQRLRNLRQSQRISR